MGALTDPIELRGLHAILVPLKHEHDAAWAKARQDGALSELWYTTVPSPERMQYPLDRPRC